ncbi:hypothetical protein AURDEDRAFT_166211 [Auricularia subglabra TFB-10046 SS5]|nr:hypothetical protein AURDEDRAFT_166211 [Auricularia subglabra TFB-10046 SS5]
MLGDADSDQTASNPPRSDREAPDLVGEELGDAARIWREYDRVARDDDRERIGNWNRGLDNLALFAGLFSAVTTAFIIQLQNDTRPDYAELTFRVLNASAAGVPFEQKHFSIASDVRATNCLWIASLMLSLAAALIAIMGKDWVGMYASRPVCNPRQWAEIRTYRLSCIERWYMSGIIASAPVLLHVSLVLFAAGLVLFVSSDPVTYRLALVLAVITGALYMVIALSAVLFPDSPYKSPATQAASRTLRALDFLLRDVLVTAWFPWLLRILRFRDNRSMLTCTRRLCHKKVRRTNHWTDPGLDPSPELLAQSLSLVHEVSPTPDITYSILVALGALDLGPRVAPLVSGALRTRMCAEVRHSWATADLGRLSRFILADQNLSPWNDPMIYYAQVKPRFEDVLQNPSLRLEDALFAAVRLYTQGSVSSAAIERCCPDVVSQPRALRCLLKYLRGVHDTAAYSVIVVARRYWRYLLHDTTFNLEAELWDSIGIRSQRQYLMQVQSQLELLVFLAVRAPPGLEKACFDLLVEALHSEEANIEHPCLVYAFGSDDAAINQAAWPMPPRPFQPSSLAKALPLRQYGVYAWDRSVPPAPQHRADFGLSSARTVVHLLSAAQPRLSSSRRFRYGSNWVALSTVELCVRYLHNCLCRPRSMLAADARSQLIRLIVETSALVRASDFEARCGASSPEPSERGIINVLTAIARHVLQLLGTGSTDPASTTTGARIFCLFSFSEAKDSNGATVSWDLGRYLREIAARLPGRDPSAEVSMRRLCSVISALGSFCSTRDDLRAAWSRINPPTDGGYSLPSGMSTISISPDAVL